MIDDRISEPELRELFLDFFEKSRKEATEHQDYDINKNNNYHLLSESGKKASRVFKYMNLLLDLLSDLEKTHTFIKRFPLKEYYEKNDIDQLDFIKYHYEVFIHKVHTIIEVKKLWLNDFYEIGLKEKDCNWKNLKGKKKLQKSSAKIIIENYYKSFEHIINFRHLNTHRGFYINDKEFLKTDLLIYNGFKKLGIEVSDDFKKMRPKFIVEHQIKLYRKEKLEYIKNGIDVARKYSELFITIILTEFLKNLSKKNYSKNNEKF